MLGKMLILLFASIISTFSNVSNAGANSTELQLITEEWAPYNYLEGDKNSGFSVEVIRAVMQELGEDHQINVFPGARGMLMLENMPNVMNFSLFRTPEREDKYKWIGPLSDEAVFFYKRKGDPRIFSSINDIKAVKAVSAPANGLVLSHADKLGISSIIKSHRKEHQLILLLKGRVDLLVSVTPIGISYYLNKMNYPVDSVVKTQVMLLKFPLYIACSKEIPDSIIEKWQSALDKVKSSARYQQIYNKYLFDRY
ncbi:substrate-binding periplasmic protein [Psychromonas ossibalaenae]|uniref:substrate-binding periplasmic protein n=1 Tax=Psychromonas ossibalaenae TaxID=444922 RepID=UPI00035E1CC6|nr:ABC transporter substrate-binding protein [Psychromonas ossibalaenae]